MPQLFNTPYQAPGASTYINEIEKKSYPIGVPSKGYDASGKVIPAQSSFMASNPAATVTPPVVKPTAPPATTPTATRSPFINPSTGKYFATPEEYANYVATKIPIASDIPNYASNAITNPNQTTTQLEGTARNLNNARNDLAVGETEMFAGSDKTAGGEQIIYSPTEREAIRKAAAGIYDPALNDVFARLKTKQDEDDAKARREEQIFATNESIRQWRATTGTRDTGGEDNYFTKTQIANGSTNAGMSIDGFTALDKDLQNFFIQDPTTNNMNNDTGKPYTQKEWFEEQFKKVQSGKVNKQDLVDDITSSKTMPEAVKHYFIDKIPEADAKVKENWFANVWSGAVSLVTGK